MIPTKESQGNVTAGKAFIFHIKIFINRNILSDVLFFGPSNRVPPIGFAYIIWKINLIAVLVAPDVGHNMTLWESISSFNSNPRH